MPYQRAYYCLLTVVLITLAICYVPSMSDTDPQILVKFKSFLFNADALNNWGNDTISLCSWAGLLCTNQTLYGLRLESMGLSGMIDVDTLLKLSNLSSFSVVNNSFEGPMPEFKKLVRLRGLFLSNNKFTGEIPDDAFEGMKYLKRIFLAENGFTGHIPTSLAKSPRLLDLDLHGNSFQGKIPEFRQNTFRVFNLSNNQLEGPIPESLSNYDPSSYAGNKDLCGQPLIACGSFSSERSPTISHQEKVKNHPLVIAAIVVVAVLALASIVALIFIASRCYRQWQTLQNNEGLRESSHSIDVTDDGFKKGENGELNFVRKDNREEFDLHDLLKASAEVLGNGRFGSTYKAIVLDGQAVVVKRFRHMNNVGKEEFSEHIRRLGRLTHSNLLPVVAFCYKEEEKLLVYDFVEHGSLASHLHGSVDSGLDWPTRLNIIKGVARGLAYLYEEFPGQNLPHGHLKSSNVLLDQSMEPHLTEYGLIPVMNKSHAKQFMAAYKAPEVNQLDRPNQKTDVWCLGILILEVLTGKFPANYMKKGEGGNGNGDLATWVSTMVREEWTAEVLDKEMMGVRNGEGEMLKLLQIGICCCEPSVESRWDWREAVAKIEELKERDREEDECSSNASEEEDELSPSHTPTH